LCFNLHRQAYVAWGAASAQAEDTIMIDRNIPKKSEMLEIRIPHPTKTAFMDKARAEGRSASEVVRDSIDDYLADEPSFSTPWQRTARFVQSRAKSLLLLSVGAVAAIAIGVAISPASAQPDLKTAFMALDVDGDGQISLSEFTNPKKALSTDISTNQPAPNARIAVASQPSVDTPVYVRFMLDTGTADGVLPLLVVVDMPKDGRSDADIVKLVGNAFAGLDRNGDGRLTPDEFGKG
jgi:EF hand